MKNTLLLICCSMFTFLACKSQDASQDPTASSSLSMKINGVEWKATTDITGSLGIIQDQQFILAGKALPGTKEQNLNISLENVTGPGTYTTNAAAIYNAVQYADADTNGNVTLHKSQKDGLFTIHITRCSGMVTEGTFSGSLPAFLGSTETIVITDGKFQTK